MIINYLYLFDFNNIGFSRWITYEFQGIFLYYKNNGF